MCTMPPLLTRTWVYRLQVASLILLSLLFTACATTTNLKTNPQNNTALISPKSIVVMPMDMELSVLTAAGLTEVRADWTEAAIEYATKSLTDILSKDGNRVEFYQRSETDPRSNLIQLEKLHQATGYSILTHDMMTRLPSHKEGVYTRSLGKAAIELAQETGSDYGLFIFVRDSYTSGGRAALIILGAVAGVGIAGGTQVGFASLVDLKNGDIVWFNRLVSTSGDLRNQDAADRAMQSLMKGFPQG